MTVLLMATIHTLDLRFLGQARRIASYLVMSDAGPILIETGPGSTFDRLEEALGEHGVRPGDITDALVTHIHFDHAGAAGLLAEHGATIHVHEFGAQHLIDPSKLLASATRIYGEDMDRLWGRIIAIPAEQVRPVHDGDVLNFGDVQITAIETPGHARHHHAFRMETQRGPVCFAGDAVAEIVPDVPAKRYVSLPTPPPEFDREQWLASIERLRRERFAALYLTHFGRVKSVDEHLDAVAAAIESHSEFIHNAMRDEADESAVRAAYTIWVRQQALDAGVTPAMAAHFVSDNLMSMNVTGIMRYWRKRA